MGQPVEPTAHRPGSAPQAPPLAGAELPPGCSAASAEPDPSPGPAGGGHSWSGGQGRPDGSPRLLPALMFQDFMLLAPTPRVTAQCPVTR